MLQFPEQFPMDAVSLLGQYVIQKNVPIADAACAAWNILGFAGAKALKKTDQTMWGQSLPTEEEQKQYFDSLQLKQGILDNVPAWVFALALNILKNFLERKVS